jgi:hypothetical protein
MQFRHYFEAHFVMHNSSRKTRSCVPLTWSLVSSIADGFIDLIVGKGARSFCHPITLPWASLMQSLGLADQRDMARYERAVSAAETHNKAVTKVVYECYRPIDPSRGQ